MDEDCPTTLACVCDKCKNPCDGTCGPNAHCTVLYHRAHCICNGGFTGDPFTGCSQVILCKSLFFSLRWFHFEHCFYSHFLLYILNKKMNHLNLVIHLLVELMHYANKEMMLDHVNVFRNIMVIRILNVDQNVYPIQNVHRIVHAWIIDVKIHVLEHVANWLSVVSSIIRQFVVVSKVISVIR